MRINRDHINRILQSRKLLGTDYNCRYYPCHFDGQDCTWCFCPFYPCMDRLTGGRPTKIGRTEEITWSCKNCDWIHEPLVAAHVLSELLNAAGTIDKIPRKALTRIRLKILKGGPSFEKSNVDKSKGANLRQKLLQPKHQGFS